MNATRHITLLLLACSCTLTVWAQDDASHSTLSLGVGVNSLSNKDAFQSPYTYKGTNPVFNAVYTHNRAKGRHVADLSYTFGNVKSVVSPLAKNNLVMLNYDYLFNLRYRKSDSRFVPSLGIGTHTLVSSTNYLPEVASPKTYVTAAAYVTLGAEVIYHINRKSYIRMQAAIPVFGIVYRPDFEINDNALTEVATIGNSNLLSGRIEYVYKLGPKLDILAAYNYGYFSYDDPRPVTILQHSVWLGLRVKL